MTYLPLVTSSGPQIAFALSKRFGNAVERNRGRRRLRSAFTEAWANDAIARPQPGAFLLTGNRGLLSSAYPELVADVARCLSQLANENKGGQR